MGTLVQPDGLEIPTGYDTGEISDGFHTFDELYHYRLLYNAALFNEWGRHDAFWESESTAHGYEQHFFNVHKSKKHYDGEEPFGGGWFIVMATLPGGFQISNHYELADWDLFKVPTQPRADKWDGHTPEDVAKRLEEYIRSDE